MTYSERELVAKRALDIVAATLGLCALSPALLAISALVKVSSPGPVLFRQRRVGRSGVDFKLLKFRSMRASTDGLQVTAAGDPRITPLGAFLRQTKLDELPSLLNVLRGDMSLVGPRPEVRRYVEMYPEDDREFLSRYRPGITDPTTIHFRNEEQILARAHDREHVYIVEILPKKLRMYREYLTHSSFMSDLGILAATLRVVVFPAVAPVE